MKWLKGYLVAVAAAISLVVPARAFDSIEFLKPPIYFQDSKQLTAVAASDERMYVLDAKKNELIIFDEKGKVLKVVSKDGARDYFRSPQGIAVGPENNVYVADSGNSRIQVFDAEGKHVRTIASPGSKPGMLNWPRSVAVGADGRVYVADSGNHRVQVYTQEGIFLFGFGEKGAEKGFFKNPIRVAVTLADDIYVLDEGNARIQKFNPDTTLAKEFKLHGEDFDVDAYGFIYMLDSKSGKVRELGLDGFIIGAFGISGKGGRQFKKPQGISVARDGTILVVDTGNRRIQRIRLANKQKVDPLTHNLATKITVTGPERKLPLSATALTPSGEDLVAFLDKDMMFSVIAPDGKQKSRFNGDEKTKVRAVKGMAASEKYGLYAPDYKGDRIALFGLDGTMKESFGGKGGFFASKKTEGNVSLPSDAVVNEKGTIYVADTGNRRVDAFSPDGSFLFSFGPQIGPYEFKEPVALAWDKDGFIYVVDRGLKKVFKCEPSGGFIKAWGTYGNGVSQFDNPVAIAYDGRSYLYVLDSLHRRVMVFDRDGNWKTNFFAGGSDDVSLERPEAITVMGDQLVIADPPSNRILNYKLHMRLAPPAEISTKAVDGMASLSWTKMTDPWIQRYRVYRSSSLWGGYEEVAKEKAPVFQDSGVEPYKTFYYRVAVESQSGDLGPRSIPVVVFIPGSFNKAPIEISTITIGNVFSANYKWYLANPLGRAVVSNNTNLPFHKVKVSFRLKDFMDFATETEIEKLMPQEKVEVPLKATLNNRILEVSEDTPIQAEATLTYFEKGKKQDVSLALPLKVYSRNAITWDDPRRIANYVTIKDPPVFNLGRKILQQAKAGPPGTEYLNGNLVIAMRMWSALGALGVKFLPSPNNPFAEISEDPNFPVDYTQFPRETLASKSGECDDLVTLVASMLEGATVKTAILDYPGHLALMFDTGSGDAMEIGLPESHMIDHDGSFWIPLETTMVGSSFEDSSRKALHAYKEMLSNKEVKITDPSKAALVYQAATLPPSSAPILEPDVNKAAKRFDRDASRYLKGRYESTQKDLRKRMKEEGETVELVNLQGILEMQNGDSKEARKRFEKALEIERNNAAALNNLGSLAFTEGNFGEALARYEKAAELDSEDPGIWMNLMRVMLKMGKKQQAQEYSKKVLGLDNSLKPAIDGLLKL